MTLARVGAALLIAAGALVGIPRGEDSALDLPAPAMEVAGIPGTYDRHHVMDDAFFEAKDWASTAEIQRFLDRTPWERPSWLARATIGGVPAAAAIVRTAQAHGINPVLLLARIQIEKSLVSPTTAPPVSARRFALGCGTDLAEAGLEPQLECAARTLETQLARARAGTGKFALGRDVPTEDGVIVHAGDAATAALYAYTPVEGTKAQNGNWLVWNVTRRFAAAIQAAR